MLEQYTTFTFYSNPKTVSHLGSELLPFDLFAPLTSKILLSNLSFRLFINCKSNPQQLSAYVRDSTLEHPSPTSINTIKSRVRSPHTLPHVSRTPRSSEKVYVISTFPSSKTRICSIVSATVARSSSASLPRWSSSVIQGLSALSSTCSVLSS